MLEDKTNATGRRGFLRRAGIAAAGLAALPFGPGLLFGCAGRGAAVNASSAAAAAGGPKEVKDAKITITAKDEPGEPLIVSGTIYGSEGTKPLAGALLYVYHTDARGLYSERDGNGQSPDPRLKGWMRTGADGRYEFRTIKPASYPGGGIPAHIHAKISAGAIAEQWIHEYWFEGDSFIADAARQRVAAPGAFSPILTLTRGGDGILRGVRDIRLSPA
ncbi:MAG: protocatechuate 3,4-dioxygenase [Pyrinomonadaceae bacterium]